MTDVKEPNQLPNEQLQTFLNIEHIRQHLIKAGLINQYGEIISKEEYERLHKRRSRRRHTSYRNIENNQTVTAVSTRHSIENTKNSKQSKSPAYHSIDRRFKTITQSRQKNKSQSPARLSSSNQSTRIANISVRRAVSPKIIPISDRCLVTMIYYGPQTVIDYERSWFEPEGDEIIVMQQHCGGENLIVHKGALKPNETFQFESRRHSDYPFALAFYVNGLIDNRLSICCESRYKHNVRIGGKRGLFGIINAQNSKACRRCRFEQRMKRLAKSKAKNTPIIHQISTPEANLTRATSPEPTMNPKESHESSPRSPIEFNQEQKTTNSPNAYSPDFDIPEEKIQSTVSTPVEKDPNLERRVSIVTIEEDSDNIAT